MSLKAPESDDSEWYVWGGLMHCVVGGAFLCSGGMAPADAVKAEPDRSGKTSVFAEYVGIPRCKGCKRKQYDRWANAYGRDNFHNANEE